MPWGPRTRSSRQLSKLRAHDDPDDALRGQPSSGAVVDDDEDVRRFDDALEEGPVALVDGDLEAYRDAEANLDD